jgi:hypothetical protein
VLQLIGAIIVVLLFIGPLLMMIGVIHGGLLGSFVELEVRSFADLVAFIRHLFNRG